MSFLLVGDNRSNVNWGGRADSLALYSLLGETLGRGQGVLGSEMSITAAEYGFQSRLFPPQRQQLARSLALRRTRNPAVAGVRWLDRVLGAGDFLTGDPVRSVRNLHRSRHRDPGLQDLYGRVAAAETVVINGEGDVVFSRPVRRQIRFFAAIVELARQLDKRVVFVNTILADCTQTGRDPEAFAVVTTAMAASHLVTVRDRHSLAIARQDMGLADVRLVPDALFHWYGIQQRARAQLPADGEFVVPPPEPDSHPQRLDLAGDYICVGGNSLATTPGARTELVAAYTRLCAGLRELGYPVYLVVADGRDRFLETVARDLGLAVVPVGTPIHFAAAILGKARLLVSGRYHPTIMAALGGTPCVFLATGTHKMQSLAETLERGAEQVFSASPSAEEVVRICSRASSLIAGGDSIRLPISNTASVRAKEAGQLGRLIQQAGCSPRARAVRS